MTHRLRQIMLIDDCAADNYLHRKVIRDLDAASEILVMPSADEALEHLAECRSRSRPAPELIFLDINTPGIEGWSFLEEFRKSLQDAFDDTCIVMLSGSLDPGDRERARRSPLVREYLPKPLTREAFARILNDHFVDAASPRLDGAGKSGPSGGGGRPDPRTMRKTVAGRGDRDG